MVQNRPETQETNAETTVPTPELKEWTLMFFMASDNPLVVSIVSQLKALKAAGFHHDVNVVAQFDPYTEGTPTHVFDVNVVNKLRNPEPNIGFEGDETIVRNLIEDKLWRYEKDRKGTEIREALNKVMKKNHHVPYRVPLAPDMSVNGTNGNHAGTDVPFTAVPNVTTNGGPHGPGKGKQRELDPYHSLLNFLNFCATAYPAKHYMLFILGHGVVVGNDIFLFDAHAEEPSITLAQMGDALSKFKTQIDGFYRKYGTKSEFDLVSFHSCSVSSLEVAYELKGLANYMLASQGPAFVGSWPYRDILMRVFREVKEKRGNIRRLINDIFQYCFHNSSDFLLAGYSFQLTLCDLSIVTDLNQCMERLSTALVNALAPGGDDRRKDLESMYVVLYAHWKSQSFFEEMYTDLYDFCCCIVNRCNEMESGTLTPQLVEIKAACIEVMKKLSKPPVSCKLSAKCPGLISDTPTVVTASEFLGPAYQYSRGLSVYFPWTRPSDDSDIMQGYETYKFHKDFDLNGKTSWLKFLDTYFIATERKTKREEIESRDVEGGIPTETTVFAEPLEQELQEDIGNLIYSGEGRLGGFALAGNKTDPWDKTGDDCNCGSIKNYPRDTRDRDSNRRVEARKKALALSDVALSDYYPKAQ